jgi:hypothetical protein
MKKLTVILTSISMSAACAASSIELLVARLAG